VPGGTIGADLSSQCLRLCRGDRAGRCCLLDQAQADRIEKLIALVSVALVFCAMALTPRLKLSVTSNDADSVVSSDSNFDFDGVVAADPVLVVIGLEAERHVESRPHVPSVVDLGGEEEPAPAWWYRRRRRCRR
jgi:hypothetical protein